MPKEKHTVWGYGRVSPSREGTSIERQWDIFDAWWKSDTRKFTFPDDKYKCDTKENWFFDAYVSGVSTLCHERAGIKEILKRMKKGDVFVVSLLDRLSRSSHDILTFIGALRESEVRFVALDLQMDTDTPEGYFAITMFAAIAQFEVDRKKERIAAGYRKLEAAGCWTRGTPPRGWKTYTTTIPEFGNRTVRKLKPHAKEREFGSLLIHLIDQQGMSTTQACEEVKKKYGDLVPDRYKDKKKRIKKRNKIAYDPLDSLTHHSILVWYKAAKANYPIHPKKGKAKKKKNRKSLTEKLVNNSDCHVPLPPALSVPLSFSDS